MEPTAVPHVHNRFMAQAINEVETLENHLDREIRQARDRRDNLLVELYDLSARIGRSELELELRRRGII